MKRILFISAAFMAIAIIGCNRETQSEEPWGDATYKVATSDATRYDLTVGKSKTIGIFIQTANGYTDPNNLDVTIKPDDSKVDEFNVGRDTAAVMLPSDAFQFSNTKTKVYRYNKNSLSIELTVSILPSMADGHYVLPVDIASIEGSTVAKADENSVLFIHIVKKYQAVYKGSGAKDDPYLIYDKQDLIDIHDECKKQNGDTTVCTYFKMMADVDLGMSPDDTLNWEPVNPGSPYDRKINFDGNGHKIINMVSKDVKYASFYGVVNGIIHDVTFENSYVKGSPAIGTIGGYCGTNSGGIRATIERVHVVNGTVNSDHKGNGTGGLVGRLFGRVNACSFDGTINDGKYIGGIVGYDDGKVKDASKRTDVAYLKSVASHITNCKVSGVINIPNGGQRTGGIIGDVCCDYTEISNCVVTAGISGNMCVAGIAAHVNWDANGEQHPNQIVRKCIVWCDSLAARNQGPANYGCGAVCGFCAPTNTCEDCYRKPDLQFVSNDAEATALFSFFDQPNSNATSPQTVGINCDYSSVHKIPYNGKAAAAGKTPSAIAKELGWDETVWDLSSNVPVLK